MSCQSIIAWRRAIIVVGSVMASDSGCQAKSSVRRAAMLSAGRVSARSTVK
jgi:hypothetical protein